MKTAGLIASFIVLLSLLSSCTSAKSPVAPIYFDGMYAEMHVGDVWQYIIPYGTDDETSLVQVTGTTTRTDGQVVFTVIETRGTDHLDTTYEFFRDGYLIYTALDTVDTTQWTALNLALNPFAEQYLAKIDPAVGDTWLTLPGDAFPQHFSAQKVTNRSTLFGTCGDVFAFGLAGRNESIPYLTVYYARGIGRIGSDCRDSTGATILTSSCCYAKVNGKTIGALRPAKNPPFAKPKSSVLPQFGRMRMGLDGRTLSSVVSLTTG